MPCSSVLYEERKCFLTKYFVCWPFSQNIVFLGVFVLLSIFFLVSLISAEVFLVAIAWHYNIAHTAAFVICLISPKKLFSSTMFRLDYYYIVVLETVAAAADCFIPLCNFCFISSHLPALIISPRFSTESCCSCVCAKQ